MDTRRALSSLQILILALAWTGLTYPLPAAWAQGTDVIVSRLAGHQAEVSIDVNPTDAENFVVMGVSESNGDHMNAIFSIDAGQHWEIVELGQRYPVCTDNSGSPTKGDCVSGFRIDPTVAFDDSGRVYVAYGVPRGSGTPHLVVCRSGDGGRTYEGCKTVAYNEGGDKWHLATGPDSQNPSQHNVFIAWDNNSGVVLARSVDGGANFSSPDPAHPGDFKIISTQSGHFSEPAVGPGGEVYVQWVLSDGAIHVACSADGGANFNPPVVIANSTTSWRQKIPAQPDNGVFAGPTIEVDRSGGIHSGRVYVAYTDRSASSGLASDIDILVLHTNDSGPGCRGLTLADWSLPARVNDDAGTHSQFLPWLDVDQQSGYAVVVWYDARNDTNNELVDVYLASTDGSVDGNGRLVFGANIEVSDAPSDSDIDPYDFTTCSSGLTCCVTGFNCEKNANFLEYIGAAAFNCAVQVVWTDSSITLRNNYVTDRVELPGCVPLASAADATSAGHLAHEQESK